MTKLLGLLAVTCLAACPAAPSERGDTETGGAGEEATGGVGTGGNKATGGSKGTGGSPGATGGSGGQATGGSGGSPGGTSGSPGGTGGSPGGTGGAPAAGGYRFGAHPQAYPAGAIRPAGDQATLDAAVASAYDKWKAAYVAAACDGYVVKTGGDLTSSSALGQGMIITAMLAGHDPEAQAVFDGLFAVGRKFPSYLSVTVPAKHGIKPRPGNGNLLAYAVGTGCKPVSEGDSAAGGDLDFAFGLLLADKQWGSTGKVKYLEEAKNSIKAIQLYDMTPAKTPGIGDWASLPGEGMWTTVAKPPNFMPGHLRAFGKATDPDYWMGAVDAVQGVIDMAQTKYSPMAGLFSQYLMGSKNLPGKATVLPEDHNANDYFDDAGLIPLRLAADYIGSGDARSKTALTRMSDFIKGKTGGDPTKIVDGYRLDGTPLGTKPRLAFVAPFAAASIFDAGNQAWVDALWKVMAGAAPSDQDSETANVLGMLIMSGNWWQP
jgi:hypothetical protein